MTDEVTNAPGADTGEHRCRTCGEPFDAENPHAPFCSERCRLADLGKWFSGQYSISREMKPDDLDELD